MIERHWKGTAKKEEAENYIAHLETETLPRLKTIDGFIRASILRRPAGKDVEFLIITAWNSMDAIRQFAGAEPELAVVPASVQKMMISFDERVFHYEVVLNRG
ncbi:MAG TPA: antibiotic biosynthesis monooxygenase [Puia sp.]|nr:antibiotic biosynthesis monooxygenase [Puia sp.]